jgi:predicted GNAT family N-acyltransferase
VLAICVSLSAQVQAMGFYERQGHRPEGEEYYDEHCPHIAMRKKL